MPKYRKHRETRQLSASATMYKPEKKSMKSYNKQKRQEQRLLIGRVIVYGAATPATLRI